VGKRIKRRIKRKRRKKIRRKWRRGRSWWSCRVFIILPIYRYYFIFVLPLKHSPYYNLTTLVFLNYTYFPLYLPF